MDNSRFKFRVWDNVDYMSKPFDLQGLQNKTVQFTSDCVVMQYTGLKDKAGKEIYEGDMVKHDAWDYPFEVIFDVDKARFVCKLKTRYDKK